MHLFTAMQGVPNRSEVRVPTPNWSGYGFSQSSPSAIGQNRAKEEITVSSISNLYPQVTISNEDELESSSLF